MVRLLIYFTIDWTFRELPDNCRWHGEMYLFDCGMNKWRAHVSHERRWNGERRCSKRGENAETGRYF